jgi:hypothetical protein
MDSISVPDIQCHKNLLFSNAQYQKQMSKPIDQT